MRLFFDQPEAGALVNAMGRGENTLRPENDLAVARGFGKTKAFRYQGIAESHASGARVDEEQAQPGGLWFGWVFDKKNVAYVSTVDFGDPAALAGGVEIGDEFIDDSGYERLEALIPAILLGVAYALAVDDPAHVADAMGPQEEAPLAWGLFREDAFDGLHGAEEVEASRMGQAIENGGGLLFGESVEFLEGRFAACGQGKFGEAAILLRGFSFQQSLFFEFGQQAAQISGVEAEFFGDFAGFGCASRGEFVQDACLGQAELGVQKALVECADELCVHAVEAAKRCGVR